MNELSRVERYGKQDVVFYPVLQIRNSSLIIYEVSDPPPPPGKRHELTGSHAYSGTVTAHAQKRIRKALDIMLQISPQRRIFNPVSETTHDFKVGFATLTVSDNKNITARQAYDTLLSPWLRYMKLKMGMRDYLWKAELQEREQIHYHIVTNEFLDWRVIRWRWNSLQKKAGLLQAFATKFGHFNPNSTDIHSVQQVQDIEAYISKYLSKTSQNLKPTEGKIWDCSTNLKRQRFSTELNLPTWQRITDAVRTGKAKQVETEHCKIFHLSDPASILSISARQAYANFIQQ